MTTFARGYVPDDPAELKKYLEEMGRRLEEAFDTLEAVAVQEEGAAVASAGTLNFIGDGVTAALNAGTGAVDVTVAGASVIPDPTTYTITEGQGGFPQWTGYSDGNGTNVPVPPVIGSIAPTTEPAGAGVATASIAGLGPTFEFYLDGVFTVDYVEQIEMVGYETLTVLAELLSFTYDATSDISRWSFGFLSGFHWDGTGTEDIIVTWGVDAAAGVGGSALEVEDEGVSIEAATTKLNFLGGGITAVLNGAGTVDVTVPSGVSRASPFGIIGSGGTGSNNISLLEFRDSGDVTTQATIGMKFGGNNLTDFVNHQSNGQIRIGTDHLSAGAGVVFMVANVEVVAVTEDRLLVKEEVDIIFEEKAAKAATTTASRGQLWLRNDNPNTLIFTDDVGTDHNLLASDVFKSGTPVNNQLAVWIDSDTIEGESDLTYSAGVLKISNGAARVEIIDSNTASANSASPRIDFAYLTGTNLGRIRYISSVMELLNNVGENVVRTAGTHHITEDLRLTEQSDHSSTPTAGLGYLWVRNDSPCVLVFTDDTGTDHDLT